MDPRVVADAVEAGEEDVIMEALRTYNREVSASRERACTEEVGRAGLACADPGLRAAGGGRRAAEGPGSARTLGGGERRGGRAGARGGRAR